MGLGHLLEDFGGAASTGAGALGASGEDLEAAKVEAYETGYKAGWEDCLQAQDQETNGLASEIARSLQDLSFTYHEARSHLVSALEPFLTQLVEIALPEMARETLGARIAEELHKAAITAADQPVRILTAPSQVETLQHAAAEDYGFPITVEGEPSLSDGQVLLRIGSEEQQIDMAEAIASIREILTGFIQENMKESA